MPCSGDIRETARFWWHFWRTFIHCHLQRLVPLIVLYIQPLILLWFSTVPMKLPSKMLIPIFAFIFSLFLSHSVIRSVLYLCIYYENNREHCGAGATEIQEWRCLLLIAIMYMIYYQKKSVKTACFQIINSYCLPNSPDKKMLFTILSKWLKQIMLMKCKLMSPNVKSNVKFPFLSSDFFLIHNVCSYFF